MTKIIEIRSLNDEALATLSGGNTSTLQQIISGLPLGPGIALPPTSGAPGGTSSGPVFSLPGGLNPDDFGPGPAIPPGMSGQH